MKGHLKRYERTQIMFAVRRAIADTLRGKLDRPEMTHLKNVATKIIVGDLAKIKIERHKAKREEEAVRAVAKNHRRRKDRVVGKKKSA